MAAKNETARNPTAREDIMSCLGELGELIRDAPCFAKASSLLSKTQELLAGITECQLQMKEELLSLKEDNLILRQRAWEQEKNETDPMEAINARVRLEEMVKLKDDEITHLKETNEVGFSEKEHHRRVIKIEKWIKRKFHKASFFLVELKKCHWEEIRYKTLVHRLKEWAVKRPWREEQLMFGEQSEGGTSTPFSHYSSFDSFASGNQKEASQRIEQVIISSDEKKQRRAFDLQNRKSEKTYLKSKSCFSKSLSVLDRVKRQFDDAVDNESRMSKQRDVILRDLVASHTSDGRDVTQGLLRDIHQRHAGRYHQYRSNSL
jgi:hypothetical protein